MRRYLFNGGFVMMDDFWSPEGWAHILSVMRGVFPDREPTAIATLTSCPRRTTILAESLI
ncbi:MAG: DUF4159 domain-containing protein [Planctomycetota bacterium]